MISQYVRIPDPSRVSCGITMGEPVGAGRPSQSWDVLGTIHLTHDFSDYVVRVFITHVRT